MLGIFGSKWVGLKNFEFFFTSQDAWRTIRNTLGYSLAFIVLNLVTAVILALMFYYLRGKAMHKIYNTIVILPKFMSVVLVAFIVQILLNPSNGVANQIISIFGGEAVSWYSEPAYWPVILTLTQIWMTVGMNSIIYYASLVGMDESMLEASAIDGASLWKQIIHIIIPFLKPIMVITTILALGNIFNGDFGLFYQVPLDTGLLYPTTDVISTYTFRALQEGSMAKSTAVGLFQSAAGLIMVLVTNGIVRKISPEDSLF